MILRVTRNLKFHAVLYAIVSLASSILLAAVGWFYLSPILTTKQLWLTIGGGAVLLAGVSGYLVAQYVQRRIDLLHVGMIHMQKGNYSFHLESQRADPFDQVFDAFNQTMTLLEEKMKEVQKLGMQDALQQEVAEKAVAEERRRLARDLHDTVSQHLFAMHMHASSLSMMFKKKPAEAEKIVNQLVEISSRSQKHIRALIAQLRPHELQGKSLQEALDIWFPDYCNHNRLQGTLDIGVEHKIPDAIEQQMFLIIQEAVANVVKHASATTVKIGLYEEEKQYLVHITDDGIGFDHHEVNQHSYGLSSMQERTRKMGGDLELTSHAGSGTMIRLRIPKFVAAKGE